MPWSEFALYLKTIGAGWIAVATGAVPAVVDLVLTGCWPKWKEWAEGHPVAAGFKRLIFSVFLVGALVWAGFSAWNDEFATRRRIEGELSTLRAKIETSKGADVGTKAISSRSTPTDAGRLAGNLPITRAASDRARFTAPLKAFYEEGASLKLRMQAGAGGQETTQRDLMFSWSAKVAGWICPNMGVFATQKFIEQHQRGIVLGATPQEKASVMMLSSMLENLEVIIERDTWDPVGSPILPKQGCETYVGKPGD